MRFAFLALPVLMFGSAFADAPVFVTDARSEAECQRQCHSVDFIFGPHHSFPEMCTEVVRCQNVRWEADRSRCVLADVEEFEYPVSCRDLPPAF